MKKHNFNAGPSILPREVIEKTAQAVLDFNGSGLSIMEISHRAKDFQPVVDEAVALFKELLNIPERGIPFVLQWYYFPIFFRMEVYTHLIQEKTYFLLTDLLYKDLLIVPHIHYPNNAYLPCDKESF